MRAPERRVAWVFGLAVFGWVFRETIPFGDGGLRIVGWAEALGIGELADDSTVAMAAVMLLFVLPAGDAPGKRLLDWETAVRIPWGLLLLFGGGIALAKGFDATGLSAFVGESLAGLRHVPPLVLVLIVALAVTFLTEVTSNTATATILLPIMAASAHGAGVPPIALMLTTTLSASCAFMLPVATAPNAIVFGTGDVTVAQMARAGLAINLAGALLITAAVWWLGLPLLG
jgi:sodium-dependent dicarboxylate transporter 2/3/5